MYSDEVEDEEAAMNTDQESVTPNVTSVATVQRIHNANDNGRESDNESIKAAYERQQMEDGAILDNAAREVRNFRLMGRLHLWSKIKFVHKNEDLPWRGPLANTMYCLCHVEKRDQKAFWKTYKKLIPELIAAKRSQVSKSVGERFKGKCTAYYFVTIYLNKCLLKFVSAS